MTKRSYLSVLLILGLILCGCSAQSSSDAIPAPGMDVRQEAIVMASEPAAAVILEAIPSGTAAATCDEAQIDYSHIDDGYVMARFTAATDKRLKVLVKGPSTTYSYNLEQGQWTTFPLSDGNGSYQVGIYQNIVDAKYATVITADFTVELQDEFAPFLRPNQYVDYACAPQTVAQGLEITQGLHEPLQKVAAVYDWVVTALTYDEEKAASVQSGYLPDLDAVLQSGKGICFDYAAVMTAMLRSQEIPCKLVVGYAGNIYHAWISVWTSERGWIDGAIFFDGKVWHRMDPTFASSGQRSQETMDFIENGSYRVKYLY